MTDRDGRPLRAFHGSNSNYDVFNTERPKKQTLTNQNAGELGSFFATPSLLNRSYYEGNAEEVTESFMRSGGNSKGSNIKPVYLSIQNPLDISDYEDLLALRDKFKGDWAKVKKYLIRQGYDGVVIRNSDTDVELDRDDWVAFRPEQIKSATGKNGEFDAGNPSSRYSAGNSEFPAPSRNASRMQTAINKALFRAGVSDRIKVSFSPEERLLTGKQARDHGVPDGTPATAVIYSDGNVTMYAGSTVWDAAHEITHHFVDNILSAADRAVLEEEFGSLKDDAVHEDIANTAALLRKRAGLISESTPRHPCNQVRNPACGARCCPMRYRAQRSRKESCRCTPRYRFHRHLWAH